VRSRADEAFEDVFEHLAVLAHRVAYRILGSAEDAEEIAQETLARAYVRWSRMSGYAEPWVARVATNLALGRWRKARSRRNGDVVVVTDGGDAALRVDLVELLRHLPRRQREVVVLRYLADRSEQQTADALGCSLGSVKQHAHRGLAALRSSLTDAPGGCDVRTT
jgi:RNA polymerase sigma factor (sigma-70 family)